VVEAVNHGRAPRNADAILGFVCFGVLPWLVSLGCEHPSVDEASLGRVPAYVYVPAPADRTGEFVRALEDGVARGDAAAITRLIDWRALAARAFAGLPARVAEGGIHRHDYVTKLATLRASGHGFSYVGTEQHDGLAWATFRITQAEPGFDHVSFLLSLNSNGEPRAVDTWSMSLGESSSSALRRLVLASLGPDELSRLLGGDAKLAHHAEQLNAINRAIAQGRFAEALAVIDALPAELTKQRWVLMMRAGVAGAMSHDAYLAAAQRLRAAYPNDPTTAYHDAAALLLTGRHDEALAAVDRLERQCAPHAYYDLYRALILAPAGRLAEARAAVRRAKEREPELADVAKLTSILDASYAEAP
jgi:hypothetical protein